MSQATNRRQKVESAAGVPRGVALLHDPLRNQGTAFSESERDLLGLQGLLPSRVFSQDAHVLRITENFARKSNDLEKYVYLIGLEDRNETLFYRVIIDNLEAMLPIIYTPTVGQACWQFGHLFRRPRGLFISANHRGRIAEVLRNWPFDDVRVIVVTDGERILGLGDLGANGMGIPVGKVSLYTACGGIDPATTLPVTIDVGTDNVRYHNDPLYIGLQQYRIRGEPYDELIDEFVTAVGERFPRALIQFEDFANVNAFRLLEKHRRQACVFNDDIQGTAAVALAGLYSAMRITGGRLRDQTILFYGAGEAGIGIATLLVDALMDEGLSQAEARNKCWFFDSKGLVVAARENLESHKLAFAHKHPRVDRFLDAIDQIQPTGIIGVSAQARSFDRSIVQHMTQLNARPIVFALSNPTSKSECTAEEAYVWSQGKAIFASGSPFEPVTLEGQTFVPGQGNNAYIFPGVGLGVVLSDASRVTTEMFMAAARTLAQQVGQRELQQGQLYPPLCKIREVSAAIAVEVIKVACQQGLAREVISEDLIAHVKRNMYEPDYKTYACPK